ncbi:2-C-methyl-D-erythritol 4-phosphate cytidylyltransferase [candidate division KSB1 bacterium]|nr:2-C-methyl-D-erythritol 4-phosphate cytidylyltransferase [candidate division KSB1 bacterium]
MKFALLVPAAGSGSRLGSELPKALVDLGGEAMVVRAIRPFLDCEECRKIVVAAPADLIPDVQQVLQPLWATCELSVVAGGATRQDSVGFALDAVGDRDIDAVLIHDAARPLITVETIRRVFDALKHGADAVLPGVEVSDTLKAVAGMPPIVRETIPRKGLYAVQTPQGLRIAVAREAFRRARAEGLQCTDDVALVEQFGLGRVQICEGDSGNFKITTPADLRLARLLVAAR